MKNFLFLKGAAILLLFNGSITQCAPPSSTDTGDKIPPDAAIQSPTNGQIVSSAFTFTGTSGDNAGVQTVMVDPGTGVFTAASGTTNWTFNVMSAPPGSNTLQVYAVDTSGNSGNIQTVLIFVKGCSKTFGAVSGDAANLIRQTSDGGYIIAGYTESFGAGLYDGWIIKLNSSFETNWQKTYGGGSPDYFYSVSQTSDGGYIAAGNTYSFGAGSDDFWILKLDSSGNTNWHKVYGGTDIDTAYSVIQTSDGGYLTVGYTQSFSGGSGHVWALKLSNNGAILWQKRYGGSGNDNVFSIAQSSDSGYVFAGLTDSFGAGGVDGWIFKTDSAGLTNWRKAYGGAQSDSINCIAPTSDNGYIAAGQTLSYGEGNGDVWVIKLDSAGNIEWQYAYGGSASEYAYSICPIDGGGYIVAGFSYSVEPNGNALLIRLNGAGDIIWQKSCGSPAGYDELVSVIQTSDGGFAAAGYSTSYGAGNNDAWIINLDPHGLMPGASGISNAALVRNASSASAVDTLCFMSNTIAVENSPYVSFTNWASTITVLYK